MEKPDGIKPLLFERAAAQDGITPRTTFLSFYELNENVKDRVVLQIKPYRMQDFSRASMMIFFLLQMLESDPKGTISVCKYKQK